MDKIVNFLEKLLNFNVGEITLGKMLMALVLLLVCLAACKMLNKAFRKVLEKSKLDSSLHPVLRSIMKVLLYALTLLIVAGSLGIDTTSLVALFSLLGLAVSLAVQGVLSNFTSGMLLLITKPFKIGDFVEAGAQSGIVAEINLTHTTVKTLDNKVIHIPNSDIASGRIINYSEEPTRRVDINVTASYDNTVAEVEAALRNAIAKVPQALQDPAPFVSVSGYQSSCIEYVVRVWTAQENYWDVHFALMHQIKLSFDEAGVKMTYDHVNVHMISEK